MYNNWEDLEKSIVGCKKCRLCDNRNNIVFFFFYKQAKLMFVGEGPGADEDKQDDSAHRPGGPGTHGLPGGHAAARYGGGRLRRDGQPGDAQRHTAL